MQDLRQKGHDSSEGSNNGGGDQYPGVAVKLPALGIALALFGQQLVLLGDEFQRLLS
jgi:hypothetical protein